MCPPCITPMFFLKFSFLLSQMSLMLKFPFSNVFYNDCEGMSKCACACAYVCVRAIRYMPTPCSWRSEISSTCPPPLPVWNSLVLHCGICWASWLANYRDFSHLGFQYCHRNVRLRDICCQVWLYKVDSGVQTWVLTLVPQVLDPLNNLPSLDFVFSFGYRVDV